LKKISSDRTGFHRRGLPAIWFGGREETIPFSNIMNVNATTQVNPPRITINLFARDELADDLIVRVDKARRSR
jgi:hypothetical protein